MDKIKSISDIQNRIASIKQLKVGFVTNFFLDIPKHSFWIQNGDLYVWDCNGCVFLLYHDTDFYHLYYLSSDKDALKEAYREVPWNDKKIVIDIIGKSIQEIDFWKGLGFRNYCSLFRMTRTGDISPFPVNDTIKQASVDDIPEIDSLLRKFFDPLSEQLPLNVELKELINNDSILLYKSNGRIAGFIIYEKIGLTLYLRYWLVLPDFRNKHIGSKLFASFMNRGLDTKRQILWVVSSNDNAIKRYLHYGFNPDGLFDHVLIR